MTPSKTLAKALARYIGDDAILSFQDGPKMPGQFVVVSVPSNRPVGQLEVRYRNDSVDGLKEVLSTTREVMYSIDVARDGAQTAADRAEELRILIHGSKARQQMLTYGLGLKSVGEVRDLTMPVDAAQEPRFQFDVFYTTVQTIEETILSIESVEITGQFYRASATPTTEG
jgi:hypothetical protein